MRPARDHDLHNDTYSLSLLTRFAVVPTALSTLTLAGTLNSGWLAATTTPPLFLSPRTWVQEQWVPNKNERKKKKKCYLECAKWPPFFVAFIQEVKNLEISLSKYKF